MTWFVYIIGGFYHGICVGEFSNESEAHEWREHYAYTTGWFGLEVRGIPNP